MGNESKNGESKRVRRGWGIKEGNVPSPPPHPPSFFGACFISLPAKAENPFPRSFFALKPNKTLATQAKTGVSQIIWESWQHQVGGTNL